MIVSKGWRKSSRSSQSTNCVEVKLGAMVGVRDTKARQAGSLAVPASAWRAFVDVAEKRGC